MERNVNKRIMKKAELPTIIYSTKWTINISSEFNSSVYSAGTIGKTK